ncbi:MAG: hypothetical protein AB1451_04415 [Nitrospirota bacterium]
MKMSVWSRWVLAGVVVGLTSMGCAPSPPMMERERPADVIDLRLAYPEAFDRVVKALEGAGYKIDVADERVGLIRTAPKAHEGTGGGVTYETVVIVRMGGTDRESWLAMDHLAIPSFPDEERKTRELLKGLAP